MSVDLHDSQTAGLRNTDKKIPPAGLERSAADGGGNRNLLTRGAKCGALPVDSNLERIIELWPDLSAETRQAMRMMAEA